MLLTFIIVYFQRMRYVAAYMLAVMGGNDNPTAKDIERIVGSVGIECEPDKLAIVLKELKGKNLEELIQKGKSSNFIVKQSFLNQGFP